MQNLLRADPVPTIAWPTTEAPDAELVERSKGDPEAFAALYLRYVDPIHRFCYRRLGTREAAEDATSQVFSKALAALPAYRDDSFRGWLFTIAHHVVADWYRTARPTQPWETATSIADASPTPEELALDADRGRALRAAMNHLPEHQRRVIEPRLAGLTGPEIGRVLGRKPKHVDVTQFRAVARLRTLLGVPAKEKEARDV